MNGEALAEMLKEIGFEGRGRAIQDIYARMEIAEEEIEIGGGRRDAIEGSTAHRVWSSFTLMCTDHTLTAMVFRIHCREIVRRVIRYEDTRPGTDAEIMNALMEMSQRAPLNSDAAALYWELFREHLPDKATEIEKGADFAPRGSHRTAVAEMKHEFQRRLSDDQRVLRLDKVQKRAHSRGQLHLGKIGRP